MDKSKNHSTSVSLSKNFIGRWNEEEHALFLEGLSKCGRSYQAISKHVKTRTANQVKSHAQKYFNKHPESEYKPKPKHKAIAKQKVFKVENALPHQNEDELARLEYSYASIHSNLFDDYIIFLHHSEIDFITQDLVYIINKSTELSKNSSDQFSSKCKSLASEANLELNRIANALTKWPIRLPLPHPCLATCLSLDPPLSPSIYISPSSCCSPNLCLPSNHCPYLTQHMR